MSPQSASVHLLIEKAEFEPQVALAVAEAIEMTVVDMQVVTVPVLDGRLTDLKAEIRVSLMALEKVIAVTGERIRADLERTKADLVRWVVMATAASGVIAASARSVVEAVRHIF
jgi:hypothetical protein